MPKFKADLSVSGIEKLKKEIINYRDNTLQQKVNLLAERLADKGVDIARANVSKLDAIFTGELLNSIQKRQVSSGKGTAVFFVVTDSDHAAFVEFGTGQMGQEMPYPYPYADTRYILRCRSRDTRFPVLYRQAPFEPRCR